MFNIVFAFFIHHKQQKISSFPYPDTEAQKRLNFSTREEENRTISTTLQQTDSAASEWTRFLLFVGRLDGTPDLFSVFDAELNSSGIIVKVTNPWKKSCA